MSTELRKACRNLAQLLVKKKINELEQKKCHKRKYRVWVKKWISRRQNLGASEKLLAELAAEDQAAYRNHLRMTKTQFESVLDCVRPRITKNDTHMRDALSAKIKLEITLRYLASGDSFTSLQYLYRVPKSTISKFVPEVCEAIYDALSDFLMLPNTEQAWQKVIQGFATRWNFPNCAGALDGKHVVLRSPFHSGSEFYNYKGTFSIVLLALVDDQYCFQYIDVGANGRASDGGVFAKCSLNRAIENNSLNIPQDTVFVADDAFPLKAYLLKPYSHHGPLTLKEKIFNYRLSRARRIVENAFGILVSRFRVFEKPIALCPEKADILIKSTCAMHNWLKKTSDGYIYRGCTDEEDFESGTIVTGSWRQNVRDAAFRDLRSTAGTHNHSKRAAAVRNKLSDWFMGEGAVPWQINMINHK